MAIMDERAEFADAVSVAAVASTINLGDIMDMTTARDMGNGQPLYLNITVDTEIITGGSAGTIAFQLVSDSTTTIATDGSQTVHYLSKTFVTDDTALTELQTGEVAVCVALPLQGVAYERYLAVQAVIATTTVTAGNVSAYLTLEPNVAWHAYPDGLA